MLLANLIERYLGYLQKIVHSSSNTIRSYRIDLTQFLSWLSGKTSHDPAIRDFTLPNIRFFLGYLYDRVGVASIRRKIMTLRSFGSFLAITEELLRHNPAEDVTVPKYELPLPRFFTEEELLKILSMPDASTCIGARDAAILELLYASGVRVSELIALDTEHINLEARTILVRRGKGRKDRIALMGVPARDALEAYLPKRHILLGDRRERALFLSCHGERMGARSAFRLVEKYAAAAGIERAASPHMFRHSFATHLMDHGANIRAIQELLGHLCISTTQRYLHVSMAYLKKQYDDAHPHSRRTND